MLQIRLNKPASETGASAKNTHVDTVTVSCPDHLILANLPVAKSLGSPSAAAVIKTVGRRSRRNLGERVHFCVRCDFPIAIYGRLSPCEHAFCLDCARSDSLCYLCDDRIQKIQTIKMMEGIFICAAPHCLKSFLKKVDFESHIHENHADLLDPTRIKEGNESELVYDREDKTPRQHNRYPSPAVQQPRAVPPEQHSSDGNQSNVFPRSSSQNRFPQQNFDSPINPNSAMAPPQFGYPPYTPDGSQQFFGSPYETPKSDSTPESGAGFRAAPVGQMNFPLNYPQAWNMAPGTVPLEPPMVVASQGTTDGFMNVDNRATQPLPFPAQMQQRVAGDRSYSGDGNQDTPPGFGRRDGIGGGQD